MLYGMNEAEPVPLTVREAASGIFGSVSMSCWLFLLVRVLPFSLFLLHTLTLGLIING